MVHTKWWAPFGAVLLLLTNVGCESCLDIEDYTIVPGPPDSGSGASTGGTGGTGGSVPSCDPYEDRGTLFAALPVEPSGGAGGTSPCSANAAIEGGIDVFALTALNGGCEARTRIEARAGAVIEADARLTWSAGDVAYVSGTFRGGLLELPTSCNASTAVVVEEPAGATTTVLVAALRVSGGSFCTIWARRIWTTEPAELRLHDLTPQGSNEVAVAGTLGGGATSFEGSTSNVSATGFGFWARFVGGEPVGVTAFGLDPADVAMGVGTAQSNWLVTGMVRNGDPACHGCEGPASVLANADSCGGSGGGGAQGGAGGAAAGGAGGAAAGGAGGAAAGGAGGAGAQGGAGGGTGDALNALLWTWSSNDTGCTRFGTFGSDRLAPVDAQVGFGTSVLATSTDCASYWTGLAGRDAWRFKDELPLTALYDTGGTTVDGFIARFVGSGPDNCATTGQLLYNMRLTPLTQGPSAVAWGNRIESNVCVTHATAAAFVSGAPNGELAVHRCEADGSCAANDALLSLSVASNQLVLMGLDPNGRVDWHSALGPVPISPALVDGVPVGRSQDNMVLDALGNPWVMLELDGPLVTENFDAGLCPVLQSSPPDAVWLLGLEPNGSGNQARCFWATQLR